MRFFLVRHSVRYRAGERMGAELRGSSELYDIISYSSIRVYRSCTNTLNWLEENGLLTKTFRRPFRTREPWAFPAEDFAK